MNHLSLKEIRRAKEIGLKIKIHPEWEYFGTRFIEREFTIDKIAACDKRWDVKLHGLGRLFLVDKTGLGHNSRTPVFMLACPDGNDGMEKCRWCNIKTKSMKVDALDKVFDYCPKCGR